MFIYGPSGSGKTTLLKAIFDKLSKDKNCLFIDGENVGSNISRSIRDSFEELYGEDRNLYEAFKNREKSQKVVFVEKIEAISSKTARDNLITELENDFDNIVIFSSDTYEQFKLLFSSGILCNYFQYVLRGFSINQRESFITKICSIFKINEEEEVNDVIKAVKLSTSLCSVLDLSGPDILLQLTIKIVKERMYLEKNVSDAFSIVFEHNINESLCAVGNREYLDKYYCVLRQLAYKIFNKNDSIYFDDALFLEALNEAKKEYSFLKTDSIDTLLLFKKSGLIQKNINGKYKFHHNSVLAYFCAHKICDLLKDGDDSSLQNILQNITYGINSDVLLFVMYIQQDIKIIKQIKSCLEISLEKSNELNFVTKNIPILRKVINYEPETQQQAENKKQMMERLNNAERKVINKQTKKEELVLDPEQKQNDFMESILKGFKLVEILSKACSGFKLQIKDPFRLDIIKLIVSSILKLLYSFYDFDDEIAEQFQKEFDDLKENVCSRLQNDTSEDAALWLKKWQDLNFPTFMYDQISTNTLNILRGAACKMTSDASLPLLSKIESEENEFEYDLFKLMVYEVSGNVNGFIDLVEEIYNNKKFKIEHRLLVNRIVRVFVINNSVSNNCIDRICSFTNFKREKLLSYKYSKPSK